MAITCMQENTDLIWGYVPELICWIDVEFPMAASQSVVDWFIHSQCILYWLSSIVQLHICAVCHTNKGWRIILHCIVSALHGSHHIHHGDIFGQFATSHLKIASLWNKKKFILTSSRRLLTCPPVGDRFSFEILSHHSSPMDKTFYHKIWRRTSVYICPIVLTLRCTSTAASNFKAKRWLKWMKNLATSPLCGWYVKTCYRLENDCWISFGRGIL